MVPNPCAPDVYFPIEITRREYSGHLLLATELAARGFTCVIGHKPGVSREMNSASTPGLLFYKNGDVPEWAGKHALMVGMDPEAGITYDDYADFINVRPSLTDLSRSSAQFAFGPDDYAYLEQHSRPSNRVHLTGSPRVELWGRSGDVFYRPDASRIADRYGPIILFTSSGGFRHEYYEKRRRHQMSADAKAAVTRASMDFLRVVIATAREFDESVVVRPHPSDSWRAWKAAIRGHRNVYVDSALDLSAWTRCSIAVVHPGSSTAAVESVIAGVPAVSVGTNSAEWDIPVGVPRRISHQAPDVETLLARIDEARQNRLAADGVNGASDLLRQKLLHPLEGATKRIADTLETCLEFSLKSSVRGRAHRSWNGRNWRAVRGRPKVGSGREPEFKTDWISRKRVEEDVTLALEVLGRGAEVSLESTMDDTHIIRKAG